MPVTATHKKTSVSTSRPVGVLSVYSRRDPTRTTVLRQRYARDMRTRFRKLRGIIRDAVVEQDVFGIARAEDRGLQGNVQANIQPGQFAFPRTSQKVEEFMNWLEEQIDKEILTVGRRTQIGQTIEASWQDIYIEDSYKRGVQRATYEMNQVGFPVDPVDARGGINAIMTMPAHVDRVGVLYTRAFNELKGITNAMDQQISRVLAQGLADGDGPRLLARKLNSTISGKGAGDLGITDSLGRFIPAQRRAEILARTEVIRAHHQGMMQTYKNWGAEGVSVMAEFRTAGDNRVCSECRSLEGTFFTLAEAENLIPVHPQCRCLALPARRQDVEGAGGTFREAGTEIPDPSLDRLDPKYHDQYKEFKKEHRNWLAQQNTEDLKTLSGHHHMTYNQEGAKRAGAAIEAYAGNKFPHVAEAFVKWQLNPSQALPTKLRQLTRISEKRVGNGLNWEFDAGDLLQSSEAWNLEIDEYLSARAFNQAFMEKVGASEVTLYRGVGEEAGERLVQSFTREGMRRTKISYDELTLSGWTSDEELAQEFALPNGFWVKMVVKREDVFMHHGAFNGISGNWDGTFAGEFEHLIYGGRKSHHVSNINWRNK